MERSAGIVLFREKEGKREFLLLKYDVPKEVYWGLAKGQIEPNESEEITALREVQEETSLEKIQIIPGFREIIHYFYKKESKTIYKEVVFFLGKVLDKSSGKVSWEHQELGWFSYEEALKKISHKQDRELLKKAEGKLK